jgi:hypothetical protein
MREMDAKVTKICSEPCVQLIGDDGKMFCEAVRHRFHQSDVIHVYVYPAGNGAKTVLHIMGDLKEQNFGDPELVPKKTINAPAETGCPGKTANRDESGYYTCPQESDCRKEVVIQGTGKISDVDADCNITYEDGTTKTCEHRPHQTFSDCAPGYGPGRGCAKWDHYHPEGRKKL